MKKLGDVQAVRNNNFNVLRFLAALLVIFSHSYPLALGNGEGEPLRQWLGIVYGQYRSAQWPMDVWPAWVGEAQSPAPRPSETVWH